MPSFDTPRPIAVHVDLALGNVRVTASDRPDTVATVTPTDGTRAADVTAAADTRVEYVDGRLTVTTPRTWKRFSPLDNGGSVQVAIDVPTGSDLEATTALGHIQLDGELGRCQLKTAMGNVRLDHATGLFLKTGFGDVAVDTVDGDADVHTGSGEVRIGRVAGSATVKNSNGATSIEAASGDVRVKAANGNISVAKADRSIVARTAAGSIAVGQLRRGTAVLATATGNVSCGITDGTAVSLDVRTKYGRISSALDSSDGPGGAADILDLHAHSSVGDITLFRAS